MKRRASPVRRRTAEGLCEVDCVDPESVAAARAGLPADEAVALAADAFRTLANPGRLRILKALEGRELCVCDLRGVLGVSMSGTSQQLRELRNLGAIKFRVDGKLVYYTIADASWLRLAEAVLGRFDRSAAKDAAAAAGATRRRSASA